ncbi:MAG: TatA/E family twin arginine-targeting protein translocase [Pleurocapsa sp. MO_192.B19]|nr:TatA/E family twin arginine-targeting protein translocase [Pleurocapsa sp. MO_192.B19]
MNIFGIGLPEMALITIVALLVFGPKKLPEIGRSVAKTIRSFQDASKEFENEFQREAQKLEESVTMSAKLEAGKDSAESEMADSSSATSKQQSNS